MKNAAIAAIKTAASSSFLLPINVSEMSQPHLERGTAASNACLSLQRRLSYAAGAQAEANDARPRACAGAKAGPSVIRAR